MRTFSQRFWKPSLIYWLFGWLLDWAIWLIDCLTGWMFDYVLIGCSIHFSLLYSVVRYSYCTEYTANCDVGDFLVYTYHNPFYCVRYDDSYWYVSTDWFWIMQVLFSLTSYSVVTSVLIRNFSTAFSYNIIISPLSTVLLNTAKNQERVQMVVLGCYKYGILNMI